MDRSQVVEFHFITPIGNLESILEYGILSNVGVAQLEHSSIAAEVIQDRRAAKRVPGGRPLHEYANLYFHARNPMMFLRKARHPELCVLRVSPDILDVPGTVVTSQNASSDYALFRSAPGGLAIVDYEQVFGRDWRDANQITYWQKKSIKCAEILVPDRVEPRLVQGIFCSGVVGRDSVRAICELPVTTDPDLFFLEDI